MDMQAEIRKGRACNRDHYASGNPEGSIPARAGEPSRYISGGTRTPYSGSIPARAGEPYSDGVQRGIQLVGLSPRVRGNPDS